MSKEKLRTIIFVNSPQNSKTPDLPQTDLLGNHSFLSVVRAFDSAWNTEKEGGSLESDRQGASVVFSAAVSRAFFGGLREEICPGLVTPNFPVKIILAGHSVGEMASFIEDEVLDIPSAAETLADREEITENPLGEGFRCMMAAIGVDVAKSRNFLRLLNRNFQGKLKVVLANINTPKEAVLSVQIDEKVGQAERESLPGKIAESLGGFKDELSKRLRVIPLPVPNAFHSQFLAMEEALFIRTVEPMIKKNVKDPTPNTIYSPMRRGWINKRSQAIDVILHQLTRPVDFVKAMKDLTKGSLDGVVFVTADVKGIMPGMITGNLGGREIPILNIRNRETLDEAIATCAKLYRGG